jgi:hypothetical protein
MLRLTLRAALRFFPVKLRKILRWVRAVERGTHAEGASGVLAFIKVIMMMRVGFIPPQASFKKMNHNINVRPDDMMEVVTKLRPWDEEHKIALLNNYGACGSNASFIIAQPPKSLAGTSANLTIGEGSRYPSGFLAWMFGQSLPTLPSWLRTASPCLRLRH